MKYSRLNRGAPLLGRLVRARALWLRGGLLALILSLGGCPADNKKEPNAAMPRTTEQFERFRKENPDVAKALDLVESGQKEGKRQHLAEAERVLLQAVQQRPGDAVLHGILGDFYLYDRYEPNEEGFLRRSKLAKEMFDKALAINPKAAYALTGLGEVYYRERTPQGFRRAIKVLERLDGVAAKDPLPMLIMGRCHFELGQYPRAERALLGAMVLYDGLDNEEIVREARRYLARIKTDQRQYALAQRLIEESIVGLKEFNERLNQDNGCPYQALGRLYTQMGRHAEVGGLYVKTAEIARNTDIHQYLAALECYRAGDLKNSRKYLRRALAIKPNGMYEVLEGYLLLDEKKYKEAKAVFERGLKHMRAVNISRVGLGHLAIIRQDHAAAEELFKEVAGWDMEKRKLGTDSLDLDPAQFVFRMACLGMGWVMANQDRHQDAIHYFDKALAQRPGDSLLLLSKGNSLIALQKLDQAEAVFKKVLAFQSGNPYALTGLGTIKHQQGDEAQAEKKFKKALAQGSKDYTCPYQGLGLVYLMQGKLEQAKKYFKKAIKLDPDIEYKKFNGLAAIYMKEGKLAEAEMLLKKSQENYPHDTEAAALLMKLKKLKALRALKERIKHPQQGASKETHH